MILYWLLVEKIYKITDKIYSKVFHSMDFDLTEDIDNEEDL